MMRHITSTIREINGPRAWDHMRTSLSIRWTTTSTKLKTPKTKSKATSSSTSPVKGSDKGVVIGEYRFIDTSASQSVAPASKVITVPPPKKRHTAATIDPSTPPKLTVNAAPSETYRASAAAKSLRDNIRHDEVMRLVSEARKKGEIIAFTDGASKGNPGFCGTGISIEIPINPVDMRTSEEKRLEMLNNMLEDGTTKPEFQSELNNADAIRLDMALAWGFGSNNYVEIMGIKECISILTRLDDILEGDHINVKGKNVHIFSDSNWAINIVSGQWTARDVYVSIAAAIRTSIHQYQDSSDCEVLLSWIKGHHKCEGNTIADTLANYGALTSSFSPQHRSLFSAPVQCDESRVVGLKYVYNDTHDIVEAVVVE